MMLKLMKLTLFFRMETVKRLVYYARVAISCFKVREVSEE